MKKTERKEREKRERKERKQKKGKNRQNKTKENKEKKMVKLDIIMEEASQTGGICSKVPTDGRVSLSTQLCAYGRVKRNIVFVTRKFGFALLYYLIHVG